MGSGSDRINTDDIQALKQITPANDVEDQIAKACDEIKSVLIEKNRSYGNSALEPVRIFSRANPMEQINVRIDDKLSRMMRGREYANEDTEFDLLGYLVLKRVARTMGSK